MTRGFLIAAPQSGSGKTTVTLAIMAALGRRGLAIAPFKCGPDFIDPGYHTLVTGAPSVNLDGWMCPESFVRSTFRRHTAEADVAIIEGAMGLFDGLGASAMEGSSAQVAALTGAPVVLVVNARGMAASAAALVKGFVQHDPRVRVAGVIFNQIGSPSHGRLLEQALAEALPGIALFGSLPRDDSLAIPSRHLGLVTAEDNPLGPDYLARLADLAERHLDLDGLAGLTVTRSDFTSSHPHPTPLPEGEGDRGWGKSVCVRIAVARDAAFCFCYPDNLRLLEEAGAEVVFFSPMNDTALPADIGGIYLPGGYPELHDARLAANGAMKAAVGAAVQRDMPVYAECGGLVYLTQGLEGADGTPGADFVGIFPVRTCLLPRRKALGYRQVTMAGDTVMGPAGTIGRGHEFHYSEVGEMPAGIDRCYLVSRNGMELGPEGFRHRNCLASYIHLHFGSNPTLASAFISACAVHRCVLQP